MGDRTRRIAALFALAVAGFASLATSATPLLAGTLVVATMAGALVGVLATLPGPPSQADRAAT